MRVSINLGNLTGGEEIIVHVDRRFESLNSNHSS